MKNEIPVSSSDERDYYSDQYKVVQPYQGGCASDMQYDVGGHLRGCVTLTRQSCGTWSQNWQSCSGRTVTLRISRRT